MGAKRRTRGEGTIFPSKSRGWVGRVIVGKKADGSPLYAERSARTLDELRKKLALAGPPGPATTVSAWCLRWLGEIRVRPRTHDIRRNAVTKWVNPVLGHLPAATLTHSQVEHATQNWLAGGLGASTVRQTLAVLHTALEAARRAGLCGTNPVKLARKPKMPKKKVDPFTPKELNAIVAAASLRPAAYPVALLATTGVRPGEALGFDVEDWDAKERTLTVRRTCHPNRTLGPPKTDNSLRTLPVPDVLVPVLAKAVGGRTTGPLFLTRATSERRASRWRLTWVYRGLLRGLGLRHRRMHQLRHSVATAAIAAGFPLADLAKLLGDTPSTLFSVYIHPSGADARGMLNGLFSAPVRGGKVAKGNTTRTFAKKS